MIDVLRIPAFRRYLLLRTVVVLAWQVQSVTVGWQVYDRSGDVLDLGWVGFSVFVPFLFAAPIAGDVADRHNRGRIATFCLVLMSALAVGLALTSRPEVPRAVVFGLLVGVGAVRSFQAAASGAILPSIVPREALPRAVTANTGLFQLCTLLGPALAGLLVQLVGVPGAHAVSAIGFLTGAALFLTVPVPDPAPQEGPLERTRTRIAGGLRYVARTPVLLGALSLDVVAVFFGGAVALLPVFARDLLAIGPSGLGMLRAATGLGAVGAAAWMAWRPLGAKVGRTLFVAVLLYGVATIGLGFATSVEAAGVALIAIGATDMVSVVVRQNLIQLKTPEEVRGRVVAVNQVFVGASNELGEMESGLAASLLGPRAAVVGGGLVVAGVVAVWSRLFPALRTLERLD